MSSKVILGLQWGDEGKGKISYILSKEADYVVRFQGGSNAGHTVVINNKRFKFHILPAGSLAGARPCIASNVVLDVDKFFEELNILKKNGLNEKPLISKCANIVLPIHKEIDRRLEEIRGKKAIGTTLKGIGPAYSDKALRIGIRMEDIYIDRISEKLNLIEKYHGFEIKNKDSFLSKIKKLKEYIIDLDIFLNEELENGKNIVFEGAQGTLLDIDHGTYPYVTSSNTTVGSVLASSGINHKKISEVVGVVKAYTTRVGSGPFPTEILDDRASKIREYGKEYGTTTGRPRRIGWIDIPLLRYTIKVNGVDWIALTKLDIIGKIDKIKVCVKYEIERKEYDIIPPRTSLLEIAKPIYVELEGNFNLSEKEWVRIVERGYDALPENAKSYIETIEKLLNTKIKIISVGEKVGMEFYK